MALLEQEAIRFAESLDDYEHVNVKNPSTARVQSVCYSSAPRREGSTWTPREETWEQTWRPDRCPVFDAAGNPGAHGRAGPEEIAAVDKTFNRGGLGPTR